MHDRVEYLKYLKLGVTVVGSGGVNAMFIGDDLPELGSNLVTALASLDMNNLSHFDSIWKLKYSLVIKSDRRSFRRGLFRWSE